MKNNNNLELIPIEDNKEHIAQSYELLNARVYSISKSANISYEQHSKFIKTHPYRYWFFIKLKSKTIGTLYISFENTIGIHIIQEANDSLKDIMQLIIKKFKPLQEIPSVRNKNFVLNVATPDHELKNLLRELGYKEIQSTFLIN